jgi:hypothetical protein
MTKTFTFLTVVLALRAGTAAAGEVPAPVADALQAALVVPGGRLSVRSYRAPGAQGGDGCTVSEANVDKPIEGSGRYPVRVTGRGCSGWAWAEVVVKADVLVTTRPLRPGDSLQSATTQVEREIRAGRQPLTAAGDIGQARAARPLQRGQRVERSHVEAAGAAAGATVKVVIRAGDLYIAQSGRVVPCGRGRTCAVMPSGKHVEGALVDGQLMVEAP